MRQIPIAALLLVLIVMTPGGVVAQRNTAPTITRVDAPGSVQQGEKFSVTITAQGAKGLISAEARLGRERSKARFRGMTRETLKLQLTAANVGRFQLELRVADKSGSVSQVYRHPIQVQPARQAKYAVNPDSGVSLSFSGSNHFTLDLANTGVTNTATDYRNLTISLPSQIPGADLTVCALINGFYAKPQELGSGVFLPGVSYQPWNTCKTINVAPSTTATLKIGMRAKASVPVGSYNWKVTSSFASGHASQPLPFTVQVQNNGGTAASSFSALLQETFQHARCTTCHGVNASNSTKPQHNTGAQCSNCHSATNWHAPDASQDFRNKSSATLCQMAKTAPPGNSVQGHLTNDPLILWAVGGSGTPAASGQSGGAAPPGSTSEWTQRVQSWIDAGMPCD